MRLSRLLIVPVVALSFACGQDAPFGLPESSGPSVDAPRADADPSGPTPLAVTTDKDDYMPGDTARITGTGFSPDETVTITLYEDPQLHEVVTWDVTADSQGGFSTTLLIEDHHRGVSFDLIATGQSSGLTAATFFTDLVAIQSVSLNGTTLDCSNTPTLNCTSVSVTGGSTIAVVVTANTTGAMTLNDWLSTKYQVEGQTAVCEPGPGVTSSTTGATHSFNITAPNTVANFDLTISVYNAAGCDSGGSASQSATFYGPNPPRSAFSAIHVTGLGNTAPDLTDPADVTIAWGNLVSFTAVATDAEAPPQTLTFSLGSTPAAPAGAAITSGGAFTWTPTNAQIGAHTIQICVADSFTPPATDCETFDVTVTTRGTALVYNGDTDGQYSDKTSLKATLTDNGGGSMQGSALSGKTIGFTLGSQTTSGTTNASGQATALLQLLQPAANTTVDAAFAGDTYYAASSDLNNAYRIHEEHATVGEDSNNPSAVDIANAASIQLKFLVRETYPEPRSNAGAMAGDISLVTLDARLQPVDSGSDVHGSCVDAVTGAGYNAVNAFTCTFNSVPVGAFTIRAQVDGVASGDYYVGRLESALTVYDPAAGFASGGGRFVFNGDMVNFGVGFGKTGKNLKGSIVVVRHHADGGFCRVKTNTLGPPAISGIVATFSGKANYSCEDADGNAYGGKGNLSLTGWMQDNGEPGKDMDKFWVNVFGELLMPKPAANNAALLVGGNIQVPHK